METVKAMYQGKVIEGEIIKTIITSTIETEDNPDSIKVMLHRFKLKNPITVLWDEVEKTKTQLWVDDKCILE